MVKAPNLSRRELLSRAAAAALVLPGWRAHAAPAEPVGYGIIGTGTQGCELLRHLATIPEGRCLVNCDIYPPNLKAGVEAIGGHPATCDDYRRVLDRPDVEAVLIATPLYLHARMVLDALDAGKHVFVEKSMFFKEDEGAAIRRAAAAHPRQVLQVGLQRRSSVLYKVAMELIRRGAIGKVTFVRAHWHRNSDWRRPVPDPRYERLINWRMYREYSGGLMAELGSHQIDVANWAIGAEPVAVVAAGGIDYWKDGRETYDNVQAIFEYPGGQKLVFTSILSNAHVGYGEEILGDQGSIVITIGKGIYYRESVASTAPAGAQGEWWAGATVRARAVEKGFSILPEEGSLDHHWLASMGIEAPPELHDPLWSEMKDFFSSIRDGRPVAANLDVGEADSRAVIYANRAIESGQKVRWPEGRS
jgi:predicted dehydrogenase